MQSDNTSKKPPPRRKACEDCSKSKRRCDLMFPACSRCSKLSLACHYQFPPQRAMGSPPANVAAGLDDANLNLPLLDDGMLADPLPYTEHLDLPFADDGLVSEAPPYLVTLQSSSKIASVADPINFDLFNPAESRLQYIVELFKSAPSRMVLENSTPWCHPLLYSDQVPKSMHDAYAACAMYIAKNDVNKRMIFRALDTGAQELLKSPQSTKPIEILARVQSLLLYQIIRLFDGDIRLRAQGETDMGDLEINAYLLLSLINDHDMWVDPSLVSSEICSPHHWNSNLSPHATWIFQESCRRTVLLCLFFTSFYGMLRETSCMHSMIAAARTFTLCAQLWNAPSEFDFKVAWKEKKQFIIENLNFEEVLLDAAPEDIDDFGKAFLVLSQGLDNMREWYYKRGGSLL